MVNRRMDPTSCPLNSTSTLLHVLTHTLKVLPYTLPTYMQTQIQDEKAVGSQRGFAGSCLEVTGVLGALPLSSPVCVVL